jgi:HEPN domain-containing protein
MGLVGENRKGKDTHDLQGSISNRLIRIITNTFINAREKNDERFNKKFGKLYLKRTKGNLRSSKILLKEKQYADSVFLLQQSVEKTLKGYALYTDVLERKDFEKHKKTPKNQSKNNPPIGRGHELFAIFKRMIEKGKTRLEKMRNNCLNDPEIYALMNITQENIDHHSTELKTALKKLREIEESANQSELSDQEIQQYLCDIRDVNQKIDDILYKIKTVENSVQVKLFKLFLVILHQSAYEKNSSNGKKKRDLLTILANGVQSVFLSLSVGMALLNLSIILKSHVMKSRYPDIDLNFDPDEYYTVSLPLVEHLEEIQDAVEKCLSDIELFVLMN